MSKSSFSSRLLKTASADEWLELEQIEGQSTVFQALDDWLGALWMRFWNGDRLCEIQLPKGEPPSVTLVGLDEGRREFLRDHFSLGEQQSRGALYHPVKEGLRSGFANFGWYCSTLPRFAVGATLEERATFVFSGDTEGDLIALWSIVLDLFAPVTMPFVIRANDIELEKKQANWQEWLSVLKVWDMELGDTTMPFTPDIQGGKIWASCGMAEQLAARARLWDSMRTAATPQMAARFRSHLTREFVTRYVEKTAKGPNTRKKILNKPGERLLSGLFGGDWLRALDYLGEAPHADEAIVTALPETRLFVGMEGRVAEVAAQTGMPEAEVRLMVESFWDGTTGNSPIERRFAGLQKYWYEFESLHDQQTTGMTPLWGLVADSKGLDMPHERIEFNAGSDEEETAYYPQPIPHYPGLYREKLTSALQNEIAACWGTTLLARYPDKLATNLNAHYSLASAFGVALRFWHGCSLTAWFLCEGPYSRTDLEGMSFYYRKQLDELAKIAMPVDESLFTELQVAGKKLGPERAIVTRETQMEFGTMTISHGSRRDGFEYLRDVITRHRNQWSRQFLAEYLKRRWETEVRETGATYQHQLHSKGKAPTAKAFAPTALATTNHWFGGDLSGFFRTIGEKSPVEPTYVRLMPDDTVNFSIAVRQHLAQYEELRGLRDEPAQYVQLEEVLGRKPEVKEFCAGKSSYISNTLKNEPKLWVAFENSIQIEKRNFPV